MKGKKSITWPGLRSAASVFAKREIARRKYIVCGARRLRRRGASYAVAATAIGVPVVSLWRYVTAFERDGMRGLVPRRSPGGPTFMEVNKITAREVAAMAARCGRGIPAGVRAYARSAGCRPQLRSALAGRTPKSLRAAVAAELEKRSGRQTR